MTENVKHVEVLRQMQAAIFLPSGKALTELDAEQIRALDAAIAILYLQREAAGGGEGLKWTPELDAKAGLVPREHRFPDWAIAAVVRRMDNHASTGQTIMQQAALLAVTAPRPTGTFGHGLTKEPLTLTTHASAEPRGESTGDTPTFADAWERLTPRDRSIISAYFCEPSRQKPQPAVTSESPGLTSESQAAAHVDGEPSVDELQHHSPVPLDEELRFEAATAEISLRNPKALATRLNRMADKASALTALTEGARVTDAYDRAWFAECRRVLEDVATEMRATGRGDTRFRRLIESMPRAALKRAEKGEGNG
jgi:hypothetical protein